MHGKLSMIYHQSQIIAWQARCSYKETTIPNSEKGVSDCSLMDGRKWIMIGGRLLLRKTSGRVLSAKLI